MHVTSIAAHANSNTSRKKVFSGVDFAHQGFTGLALCGSILAATILISHSAHASNGQICSQVMPCWIEVAQQSSNTNPATPSGSTTGGSNEVPSSVKEGIKHLTTSINEQNNRVAQLRQTNHVWNIAFVATGVSMTLLATALGAVSAAGPAAIPKTTITIAVIGAVAAAAQTIASKIPVAKRAGEYAKVQATLVALNYKTLDIRTQEELKVAQKELQEAIKKVGDAEAAE